MHQRPDPQTSHPTPVLHHDDMSLVSRTVFTIVKKTVQGKHDTHLTVRTSELDRTSSSGIDREKKLSISMHFCGRSLEHMLDIACMGRKFCKCKCKFWLFPTHKVCFLLGVSSNPARDLGTRVVGSRYHIPVPIRDVASVSQSGNRNGPEAHTFVPQSTTLVQFF